MPNATVPLTRFKTGDMPPVCASSGVPAANVFQLKISGVQGAVPLHADVVRSITRVQLACKIAFVVALGVSIVGVATRVDGVMEAASVPLVIGVGLLSAARARVPGGKIVGDEVRLVRVHSGFVSALTKPPGKCADCNGASSCSVAEMDACEGATETEHDHQHTHA